jgi:hypothetical protein
LLNFAIFCIFLFKLIIFCIIVSKFKINAMDRNLLPRGFAKIIASKINVSIWQVYNVVNMKNENETILIELLKLIKERKEKQELIRKLIAA